MTIVFQLLNKNIAPLFVYWSSKKKSGTIGDIIAWPHSVINGKEIDLSIVQNLESDIAMKLFATCFATSALPGSRSRTRMTMSAEP